MNILMIMFIIVGLLCWGADSFNKLSRADWNPVCGVPFYKYKFAKVGVFWVFL